MQKNNNLFFQKLLSLIAVLFLVSCDQTEPDIKDLPNEVVITNASKSLNNQGVGEMGYFNYSKATESFEKLVQLNPDWGLAKQNLAIAMLNRQKPGDEEMALKMAEEMAAENEENLVALYIIGILKFNQGLCEQALPRFSKIITKDTNDAYAMYFAGQCELQNGNIEKALGLYQDAIKTDSYLRSAYYGGFMAAQRLQKGVLAKEMLESYQKLDSNPKAKLAEIKYTRMGPKAIAQAYNISEENVQINQNVPPYFMPPVEIAIDSDNIQNFGLVNLQQSKNAQMYVVSNNQLKVYDDFFNFAQELSQYTIDLNKGPHQIAWGDINNDNQLDVYITGDTDQLYLQNELGFNAVDMQAFGLSQLSSKAVRLSDSDHDGDLDILLLNKSGVFELWNNNLNNTFTALSNKTQLISNNKHKGIYLHDLDSDRDTDIILYNDNQISILINDRMWDYQLIQSDLLESKINSISLSDNDIDGTPEMNVLMENQNIDVYKLVNNQIKKLNSINNLNANQHISIDTNGNGLFEHLLMDNKGIKVIDDTGTILEEILVNNIKSLKVKTSKSGPELLFADEGKIYYSAASKNRSPFMLLNFSGKEDDANAVRSNFSGIGTRVLLHSVDFYAIADNFQNLTGIDQDYQPINVAAGTKEQIDFIGIEWSDGVYQTELALPIGQFHKITETQRQLSSCPVIFVWNNGQYEFASDVLGVGGIGFAIGRHEYGQPRPWENYLIKNNQISSDNGVFRFQFTEPMEESAYLDEMQVQVIDVPEEWSVILDERMQISDPIVTGETLFYQSIINPLVVTDNDNNDVTELALTTDKRAIEINNQDHRFLGIVDEQIITLEFEETLIGEYQLVMNGWVEYGYSQTMFAAWQAGMVAQAPTLEYFSDGEWKILLSEFGYPAGMPREASVPISLPEETQYLRIRTNMEIYFDQLGLVKTEQPELIEKYQLKLKNAQLQQLGFPKRQDNQQRVPSYDFNHIQPFWDTRYMEGAYTQIGDVTELLTKQDNALAIIGAGEGIEIEFEDDLPILEKGMNRYYILKFKGWAKDMDILTKDGETLEPIPVIGSISDEARELNLRYNNRFKAGK